jgi:hypothetical protein
MRLLLAVVWPTALTSLWAQPEPVINYFYVAPASTMRGQAAIASFSVSGATAASVNGLAGGCSNGTCTGNVAFYPNATTNYVLEVNGIPSASQAVEVGQYLPNPLPAPPGLQITWQGACWFTCRKGERCQGMAFDASIPTPPAALPLQATLYLGSETCNPSSQDNLNDLGTLTGSGGWIFWFTHHPNRENSSAIWTFGNQSSGCVSYAKAPTCQ